VNLPGEITVPIYPESLAAQAFANLPGDAESILFVDLLCDFRAIRQAPAVPKVDRDMAALGEMVGHILINEVGVSADTAAKTRAAAVDHIDPIWNFGDGACVAAGRNLPQKDASFAQSSFDAVHAIAIGLVRPRGHFGCMRSRKSIEFAGCELNKPVHFGFGTFILNEGFTAGIEDILGAAFRQAKLTENG
jgi:hypothetical protein